MSVRPLFAGILVSALTMAVAGCTGDTLYDESAAQTGSDVIAFDSYVGRELTRTAWPSGKTGDITTLSALRLAGGFGVMAQYTGTEQAKDNAATVLDNGAINFMWNQQVHFSSGTWIYTPLKYWPNGNGEASDATGMGATRDYVSFAAYAPYATTPTSEATTGITAISADTKTAYQQAITYTSNITNPADDFVDLLVAEPLLDQYKQAVDGRLTFDFTHALAKLKLQVQAIFDATTSDATDSKDTETKILIDKVSIKLPTCTGGNYCLFQKKWEYGSYDDGTEYRSYVGGTDDMVSAGFVATDLRVPSSLDMTDNDAIYSAFDDLMGVSENVANLLASGGDIGLIPNTGTGHTDGGISVTIDYYVLTRDDRLVRTGKISKVKNSITRDIPTTDFTIDANKEYTLKMILGMTSVKFEVVEIDDWGYGQPTILFGAPLYQWDEQTGTQSKTDAIVLNPTIANWATPASSTPVTATTGGVTLSITDIGGTATDYFSDADDAFHNSIQLWGFDGGSDVLCRAITVYKADDWTSNTSWPTSDSNGNTLTFQALSKPWYMTGNPASADDDVVVKYTVNDSQNNELIWAKTSLGNYQSSTTPSNALRLIFQHPCAAVRFVNDGATCPSGTYLGKITIEDLYNQGHYSQSDGWTDYSTIDTEHYFQTAQYGVDKYVIPQDVSGLTMKVTLINSADETEYNTYSLTLPDGITWQSGHRYEVKISGTFAAK